VARIHVAGAIGLGKTNLPALSWDGQASNPIFGRTNNPWDLARVSSSSTITTPCSAPVAQAEPVCDR
jgi:amidase